MTDVLTRPSSPAAEQGRGQADPLGQEHRGHLRPRHPGAQGRLARGPDRRHRRSARGQRRRQVDNAEIHLQSAPLGARRGHQGLDRVQGRARRWPHAQRSGAPRLHPGDGGAPLLRPPDGGGKPADRLVHPPRRTRRRRCRHGDGLQIFPAPEGAPPLARRLYLRRRAADGGDRPRADVEAQDDAAGRAVDGIGAAAGRGDLRDRQAAQRRSRASPCCWPSRTPTWR